MQRASRISALGGSVAAAALLSGCGGGSASGGVGSTPTPPPVAAAPTPSPTPTPVPTPAPTSGPSFNSNSAEARRTDSFGFHGAITAYTRDITGQGITVGVIDSGIDADSPEFAGRIHAQSFDAAGTRSIDATGAHGTHVAQVLAGAKNDAGSFGIAFGATLLVARADRPGSCTGASTDPDSDGCRYPESAIAAGLDRAVAVGAKVVNISLGGDTAPGSVLRAAVARATAAGVILVVSAGNEGDSTAGGNDPNNPAPFAQGIRDAGGGLVIIVGSVDDARAISTFSNRAGGYADSYLAALGDGVCCVYENGALKTETRPDGTFIFLLNGTSFAAPQVAGAIALVAQAFPALTAQQIVSLLYQSARDGGAAGTDASFGRGVLDIGRAFSPIGPTSLAGTGVAVSLTAALGSLSAPMGDARGSAVAAVTDGFGRAFDVDLGAAIIGSRPQPRLLPALGDASFGRVAARGATALSLRFAPATATTARHDSSSWTSNRSARALAASLVTRLSPRDRIGFAIDRGLSGLVAGERGLADANLLIAPRAGDALAPLLDAKLAALWRHDARFWGQFSLLAEQGWVGGRSVAADPRARFNAARDGRYARLGLGWDRRFGPLGVALTLHRTREDASMLGARLGPVFGAGGATSFDVQLGTTLALPGGWSLSGEWSEVAAHADRAGLVQGGQLNARARSVDLTRSGILAPGDRIMLRYAEPLRVTGGGINLTVPTAHQALTGTTLFGTRTLSVAPQGHERVVELGYRLPLGSGVLSINSWWRGEPGHFADLKADLGGAVRFSLGY